MLVMRRRTGDSFLIGSDIEIEILEITPARVKIGITAPSTCVITRREVMLTREENLTASRGAQLQTVAWLSQKLVTQEPRPASAKAVK